MLRSGFHRLIAQGLWIGLALLIGVPAAQGQLFESDSKSLGSGKMDIVVREVERRPRSSVVDIRITTVGSSVGSSFFILCSIRDLARQRGDYRYIVKLDDRPQKRQMLVGFLRAPDDRLPEIDAAFAGVDPAPAVIDLEQFAKLCGMMK